MKYLILGAGPAGLSFAHSLMKNGENDFLILEKENEAGGLCRSKNVDGAPLDTGGGHFLDVRNKDVLDFLFAFLPENEWNQYERDSRIQLGEYVINSPIEANLWQLPIDEQIAYLKDIAVAGCNLGVEMSENFTDWIEWKLGKRIAERYMFPYNRKMFGAQLDELGTYWLEKLPNVSFDETLRSCLERKAYGSQPGHASFYYPQKYGYGEIWNRMADALGEKIKYGIEVEKLDFTKKTVNDQWGADKIITTIPWTSIKSLVGISDGLKEKIGELKHSSVVIQYKNKKMDTDAQWIYYPDESLSYHRILVRKNFIADANGYWTETNKDRFMQNTKDEQETTYINEYAYPLNTRKKPEIMKELLQYAEKCGIYGLGRWGEWQHYNSDVVVGRALALALHFYP